MIVIQFILILISICFVFSAENGEIIQPVKNQKIIFKADGTLQEPLTIRWKSDNHEDAKVTLAIRQLNAANSIIPDFYQKAKGSIAYLSPPEGTNQLTNKKKENEDFSEFVATEIFRWADPPFSPSTISKENFKTLYVDSDKELLVFVDCTIIQRCLDDSFEVQVDFLPENGCARKDACKDNGDFAKCSAKGNSLWEVECECISGYENNENDQICKQCNGECNSNENQAPSQTTSIENENSDEKTTKIQSSNVNQQTSSDDSGVLKHFLSFLIVLIGFIVHYY